MTAAVDHSMFVYVIGPSPMPDGPCLLKIGSSNAPTKRCKALQRASEVPLEVYTSFVVAPDDALRIERYAQWLLSDYWHRSEWFTATAEMAQDALDHAVVAISQGLRPPHDFRNPDPKIERVVLASNGTFLKDVDDWRRRQDDLPNRSEAIRRLVELGLEASR